MNVDEPIEPHALHYWVMKTHSLSFVSILLGLGVSGCSSTVYGGLDAGSDSLEGDDSQESDGDAEDPVNEDPADNEDPAYPIEPTGTCFSDLTPAEFTVPADAQACSGQQFIRFVPEQDLWLGFVSCGDGSARFYLAASESGPFFPATDTAGHGQDHCELVRSGFTLPNEDEITTGCAECSTGMNLPLEYVPAYSRANAGEPFTFTSKTGYWSYQASRIDCGCGL